MLLGNLVAQLHHLFALKLNQRMTLDAVQVIMLRIAVIVFVHATAVEFETSEQACIDKLFQRAIDSRPTNVIGLALARQLVDQLIGIKVLVTTENLLDQVSTLVGAPQSATLQILFESIGWRLRYADRI